MLDIFLFLNFQFFIKYQWKSEQQRTKDGRIMTTELDYMVRSQITRYGFNGSIEILSEYWESEL